MVYDTSKRSIPLDQRFQKARVAKIGLSALEMELIDCPWGREARVQSEHLPQGKQPSDYPIGDSLQVFLLRPSRDNPHRYYASIRWADPSANPWRGTQVPSKGQLLEAEASRFLRENTGVFVRLDNGIDALLSSSAVPGNPADIRNAVDLGDRFIVEIIAIRQDLLEVDVSLNEALRIQDAEETQRRKEQFNRDPIEIIPRADWRLPPKPGMRVGVLVQDIFFREHLTLWLESFGYSTLRLNDPAHLRRVLQAHNGPTHLILAPESWPGHDEEKFTEVLLREIHSKAVSVVWLKGPSSPEVPPFPAPLVDMPLRLDLLLDLLTGQAHPDPSPPQNAAGWLFDDYQSRHVQHLVGRFLEHLCEDFHLAGALWVVREQPGLFHVRFAQGLDEQKLAAVEPQLGQSMVADSIEKNEPLDWEYAKLGPLKSLVPDKANRVLCYPIPFTPLFSEQAVIHRAVVLFYHSSQPDPSLERRLRPYREAMEILVHTLHFARHNETLSALAELGRRSASYLHELGQKAFPLQAFLDQHGDPTALAAGDWNRLRSQLAELVEMARADLGRIRKHHQERLQLRDRLTRLAKLYSYRFNAANCAFEGSLPDMPMLLTLNPLIVDQAVSNLLDNALHFAGQRTGAGRVRLEVRLSPEDDPKRPLVIEVTDNGIGVRASMKSRLFEPRHSGKEQGTGMGLFIAQSFVRGLGGDLQLATSLRWKRTCFRIRLPVILGQGTKS